MPNSAWSRTMADKGRKTAEPPRIYTVPSGQPFLECLARALLNGDLPVRGGTPPSAIDLTGVTLYLPTRRATRALQDAFLKAGQGRAMLLPTIKPIAEGDESLSLLVGASEQDAFASIDLPPAISTAPW